MLAAVLGARLLSGSPTFLLEDLLAHPLQEEAAFWVFLGFALAFAIKTPLFPLHAWLPPFHQENHPSGLADALGTLYKVGVFAFFRFAIPLAPEGFAQAQGLLLFLAALSALYGAWVAFAAKDFKTLLAYAGLSHMGVAALGVFSGTPEGAMGAIPPGGKRGLHRGALPPRGKALRADGHPGDRALPGPGTKRPGPRRLGPHPLPRHGGPPRAFRLPRGVSDPPRGLQGKPWLAALAFLSVIASAAYALTAFQKTFWEEGGSG